MKSKQGLGGVVGLLMAFLSLWASSEFALAGEHPGLSGVVKAELGEPLKGAHIFIYTAEPKVGVGVLCPFCYADCRKQAVSDADGKFAIDDLDPTLRFRVLVAVAGYQPTFVSNVDPVKGPIQAKLREVSQAETPDSQMRGRVTDLNGKSIHGAVVEIRGVTRGETTQFGGNNDVDPLAVTDEEGKFTIYSQNPFKAIGVEVSARGYAKGIFSNLESGETVHELKLGEGVSVKGRLLKDGKPLAGIEVGISGSERSSEVYVGNATVGTDEDGNFLFSNMTPNSSYELYGVMKSLGVKGSVPVRAVHTGAHGSTLEAGDLKVEPAYTIGGVLRLTDNSDIPEKTRIFLGRENAWDSQQVEVDSEGHFRFEGVPGETVTISAGVRGYRFSSSNGSLEAMNMRLLGRVVGNKTNLILELEPGRRASNRDGVSQIVLSDEPLRGVEEADKIVGGIAVTGRVTDAETGRPLESFTITEGRIEPGLESVNWLNPQKIKHKDGSFELTFPSPKQGRSMPPVVMAEAEGYVPQRSERINASTNLTFALKKGSGPSGIVLKPDGSPAPEVTVYLTDMRNGVYVQDATLKVREEIYSGTAKTMTDDKGYFSFPARIDSYAVIILDEAGFAQVRVGDLGERREIRLQPWSRVEGKLLIGDKPAANQSVRLWLAYLPYEDHPRAFSPLNLYLNTKTSEDGSFAFERVPPVKVEVYYSPEVSRGPGPRTTPMSQTTKLVLKPNETAKVTLGGKGRPVAGRMVLSGYEGDFNWQNDTYSITSKPVRPLELPDAFEESRKSNEKVKAAVSKPMEERAAIFALVEAEREKTAERTRAFYRTEAGWNYHAAQKRYALQVEKDGSFRVDDVPGGTYTLSLRLMEGGLIGGKFIANMEKDFEVPESPGGRSDEPFDLGTIEVAAKIPLKTGKTAPDFEVKTIDGQPLKLSSFKGKYVLLDFWAVWCGPCVAETPFLKETYEAFKGDPRFTMIGLSLDPEKEAPIDYRKKNELGWIQGFLGNWTDTKVPSQFGVEGIPSIFLIDPEGKIVKGGLRGAEIKAAVQSALAGKH